MRTSLAVLLASLLVSAVAQAQDACLTGPSTLADQRAFAALAETTEATCPCTAAATGRAWQRCAKGVLNAALASGTLRRECEKTGRQTVHETSCGGSKLPCGTVRVGGDGPPTCRLAKSCEDSRRADRTACTAETSCSDVVTWTAGTPRTLDTVPFLEQYLAGRDASPLLGPPTGPGSSTRRSSDPPVAHDEVSAVCKTPRSRLERPRSWSARPTRARKPRKSGLVGTPRRAVA
jgi:hypothetical protein